MNSWRLYLWKLPKGERWTHLVEALLRIVDGVLSLFLLVVGWKSDLALLMVNYRIGCILRDSKHETEARKQ